MSQKFVVGTLVLIVFLACFVRLFHLTSVPPSPYLDEVSNGYNAYSFIKTGSDEYGRHLPFLMQAYNDGRPTLFVYFMTPFIQIFGLNLFAIRLPAVVLSVFAVISLFFLTRELFIGHSKKQDRLGVTIGLLASFLYAISPWNIYSARIADEVNMSVSFFIFGLTLFIYAINRRLKSTPFLLSVVCFVIAFYAYHGIKLFLPFFAIGLGIVFFKDFLARKRVVLIGLLLAIILLITLAMAFSEPGATSRLGGVNREDPNIIALSSRRLLFDRANNDLIGQVLDNRRVALSMEFANNYLRNFAPTWLFLQQGNSTFLVPDFGPLYHFGLPLLLLGLVMLIHDDTIPLRYKALLALWIFASVIPAGLSSESPHLNRPNTIFPGLIVLQAMGLYTLLSWIRGVRNWLIRYGAYFITCTVIVSSFLWFLHAYFALFPYEQSKRYQYGLTDAFLYAKEHEDAYQKIIISNGNNLLMSYMYYLFATAYDPETYQKQGGTKSAFFTDTHLIGKYDFRNPNLYEPTIDKQDKRQKIKVLYITNPLELSDTIIKNENVSLLKKFQLLDGSDSIWILEAEVQKKD